MGIQNFANANIFWSHVRLLIGHGLIACKQTVFCIMENFLETLCNYRGLLSGIMWIYHAIYNGDTIPLRIQRFTHVWNFDMNSKSTNFVMNKYRGYCEACCWHCEKERISMLSTCIRWTFNYTTKSQCICLMLHSISRYKDMRWENNMRQL